MRCLAAGVVLLVAAVTGCSADEAAPAEVAPLASGSASPSGGVPASQPSGSQPSGSQPPSALATAAPDGRPVTDFPMTVDGASAFAREYVRLIGDGFATGRSAMLRKHTAPGCEGCEALIGAIDRAAAEGLRLRGGQYEVSTVATPPIEGGDVVLLLTYTRSESEVLNAADAVVERAPAVPMTTVQMRLIYGSSRWLVQGYRVA